MLCLLSVILHALSFIQYEWQDFVQVSLITWLKKINDIYVHPTVVSFAWANTLTFSSVYTNLIKNKIMHHCIKKKAFALRLEKLSKSQRKCILWYSEDTKETELAVKMNFPIWKYALKCRLLKVTVKDLKSLRLDLHTRGRTTNPERNRQKKEFVQIKERDFVILEVPTVTNTFSCHDDQHESARA